MFASRRDLASASRPAWISSSSAPIAGASASRAGVSKAGLPSGPHSRSRRSRLTVPASMSRGPTSTITGAPRRTQSQRLAAALPGRVSCSTRTFSPSAPCAAIAVLSVSQYSSRAASLSLSRSIGSITTCCGASAGGTRRPSSSPWVMISAPTIRVETPQLVVWASCWPPSRSWKRMLAASAKLVPR